MDHHCARGCGRIVQLSQWTCGQADCSPVQVLPATPPTFSTLPGAVVDTGEIHRAPLERALRDEREAHDRTAEALAGVAVETTRPDGLCWCLGVQSGGWHTPACERARAALAALRGEG